jgi:transcriptional regulator GlxA family with amidase domain
VPALASYVGCAPDYLSHIFHLETGETISACIKRERLAVGRHLLETTGMNINEVALSSGFADSNYFSRQFRQAFGFSPRTYRKELC